LGGAKGSGGFFLTLAPCKEYHHGMENTLFYGDNLNVLAKHVEAESVDLVYLDPPFNSNRDYNVLFKEQSGNESPAQIKAFGDTWNWAGAASVWDEFSVVCPNEKVIDLMSGFVHAIGQNDVTAYLVMMAPRLFHLHRALKPTGSLYLHCDPTASHYLKLILDAQFGTSKTKSSGSEHRPIHRRNVGGQYTTLFSFTQNHLCSHGINSISLTTTSTSLRSSTNLIARADVTKEVI